MLYNAGDSLLFYPESPPHARIFVESPSAYSLPFENVFVRAVDGPGAPKLNLVFIKQHDIILPMAPTVVYFHGNAGNVGHRLPNVDALYKQFGCNVLLVSFFFVSMMVVELCHFNMMGLKIVHTTYYILHRGSEFKSLLLFCRPS